MNAPTLTSPTTGAPHHAPRPDRAGRGAIRVVERNVVSYRRTWPVFVSGVFEPLLFLMSIGLGVGGLVGKVPGPGGQPIDYDAFVAPGLMAAAAMNFAAFDATFNFFVRFKYIRTYDAMLATPLRIADVVQGEAGWCLVRNAVYAAAFLVTMLAFGLVHSWWAILAIPGSVLIAFAFAGAGLAGTTFMRSWTDFDFVNLALVPMFLFSATFFPLDQYPDAVAEIVKLTPLYQGVAIERSLVLGDPTWSLLIHVGYLAVMGTFGVVVATRRLGRKLQP